MYLLCNEPNDSVLMIQQSLTGTSFKLAGINRSILSIVVHIMEFDGGLDHVVGTRQERIRERRIYFQSRHLPLPFLLVHRDLV